MILGPIRSFDRGLTAHDLHCNNAYIAYMMYKRIRPKPRKKAAEKAAEKANAMTTIDEIVENFSLLDEWDDRYRYVIELGRTLAPLPDSEHTEANKVRGCASQVWLVTHVKPNSGDGPVLYFAGDSDAHIVRGLVAILFALYSGRTAREILDTNAHAFFDRLELRENLTPQRSNGLNSMIERIRAVANSALSHAA